MTPRIAETARRRGVTRLVHFTPARNLPPILDAGAVRPAAQLRSEPGAHFAATDPARLDRHADKTSCSIEYPNVFYLRIARARSNARSYPDWVALLLDVDLLDRPGVLLSPRNAAAGTAVAATVPSFEALYAPTVTGRRPFHRRPTHLPAVPTDLQAEVLVPDQVSLSQVRGLLFSSQASHRTVMANLVRVRCHPPAHWTRTVCPQAFDPDELRRCVHAGVAPEEHDHV